MPNVVLEAMSFEVPVVVTNVGELAVIVENRKTGWIVEKNSSEQLAAAVIEALADKNLMNSVAFNAKKMIEERFSAEARCKIILDLYEQLLEGR